MLVEVEWEGTTTGSCETTPHPKLGCVKATKLTWDNGVAPNPRLKDLLERIKRHVFLCLPPLSLGSRSCLSPSHSPLGNCVSSK